MTQLRPVALAVALALATPTLCLGQNPRPHPGEQESSANLDAEDLGPVLTRLRHLTTGGLTTQQADSLRARITAQPVQTEATYPLHLTRAGRAAAVRLVVWKDDPQAYDVFFFTTADLAKALDREIAAYMASVGK